MPISFQRWQLMVMLTCSTRTELIRQVQYLKVENRILRGKLSRQIPITPQERETLVRYGRVLGTALRLLISIVTPNTFNRWVNGERWRKGNKPRKRGRPRTAEQLEQLILRIARETGWGYVRILGELKKLGVGSISRSTVVNILRRHGVSSGPQRGASTWDQFIRRHAQTLWACDFLARRVWTWKGWREAYVLVFIHIQSRRVHISPSTFHPTRWWAACQAARFCEAHRDGEHRPELVLRDCDSKFASTFERALSLHGAQSQRLPHCSPNMNAHAERFIQTLQQECLDHFVLCGLKHLDHLVREYVEHYHDERPHQGLGNRPLSGAGPPGPSDRRVRCHQRLGGLLRHYYRQAA